MNKTRLLFLADALETRIPAKKFDLSSWRDDSRAERNGRTDDALLHNCGTTACAVGWACALPDFQKEGLIWDDALGTPMLVGIDLPEGEGWRAAWHSIEQFFGLKDFESSWLFTDEHYCDKDGCGLPGLPPDRDGYPDVKPRHVADRIRHLLAGKQMEDHTFEGFAA